ncbi:acetyltransferase GNAT family protein [Candidatus Termititenax aidoneus]|uniref:Acetyltransferase GNAT family protein n=1 Tax=Termititenax aidoneus TaxID=2218524 RepID=A0A388TAA3_TERA1|nr:acetyltransferase GNAT family protein [Candidatus Termititenax aidoneus]
MSEKITINLRHLEKRDIPKVAAWLTNEDYYRHNLTNYPYNNKRLLQNQLLKEIAVGRLIEARTRLLIAEANGEILTAFIALQNFNWQNRNAVLQIYIPAEFRNTDLGLIIVTQAYNYIFKDLDLHKVYTYVSGGDTEKLERYKAAKQEPEAVLYNYLRGADGKPENLHIFGIFKKDVLKKSGS